MRSLHKDVGRFTPYKQNEVACRDAPYQRMPCVACAKRAGRGKRIRSLNSDLCKMATPVKPWELRGGNSSFHRDGRNTSQATTGGPSPPPAIPPRPANMAG